MAKVNVRFNDKAFALRVSQSFEKVKKSRQLNSEIGKFVADRVRGEAKRGRPFNKQRKYPSLKEASISIRKSLAKLNPTGKPFRPSFSNTTLSGQLLNSIGFEVKRDFVIIEPMGRRKPLTISKSGTKEKLKSGVNATNKQLAKTLAGLGFVIFDAKVVSSDDKILKRINSLTLKFLRRSLKVAGLRS